MSTDRRSYENEWLNQPGPMTSKPLSDPLQSAGQRQVNHDTGGRTKDPVSFHFGVVIESFSYLHAYRVSIENGSIVQCSTLSHQSNLPYGTSESHVYGPGQLVLVVLRSSAAKGVIIGAVPPEVINPNDYRPDAVFSGSNVGYFNDATSNYWTGLDTNDLIDFSAGRSYDITCAPQTVVQGVTGVGYMVTDDMAAIKGDEETGLFVFYDDSMARFTGRNIQIRAHGLESEQLNDESELNGYRGIATYLWENMGAYQRGVQTSIDVMEPVDDEPEPDPGDDEEAVEESEDEEVIVEEGSEQTPELTGIRYGFIQPIHPDQQAFHRVTRWEGYIGQGGRDSVIIPGPDVEGRESELVNSYTEESRWLTMLAKQDSLAGKHTVTASGDIMFYKRPPLPTPKRIQRPESPLGDRGEDVSDLPRNYDPCGIPHNDDIEADPEGLPYTHIVTDEIPLEEEPVEGEEPEDPTAKDTRLNVPLEVLRSAAMADDLAYTVAWEGVHTFHYHTKDFYLPQESELGEFNRLQRPPYESLARVQYMGQEDESPYPNQIAVKVDHKYGEVNVYLNDAYFGLRKNGSFVLRTGCGCEIKSENGSLDISAPADIRLRPGRDLITIAGNDTIVKSRKSVDITSSTKDIRLAAWNNLMAVAAVSEEGVLLLQSNSKCIIDPEVENTVEPEIPEDPEDGDEPVGETTYLLGEEVKGSGILFKARTAQVTASGFEINLVAGKKEYVEPETDENGDPQGGDDAPEIDPETEEPDKNPETGEQDEKKWNWIPGRIRVMAEKGQVETLSSYFINFVTDTSAFGSEYASDAGGATGACLQVFMTSREPPTDDDGELLPNELPPNILAAAGVADLSSTNTCKVHVREVCYDVMAVNEFRDKRSSVCGQLSVGQELFVGGCAYVRGNLSVFDHLDVNFEPKSFDGRLWDQRADVKALFDESDTRCLQLLPNLLAGQAAILTSAPTGNWLDFSFRTMEQYGTQDNCCIMESWWQHQVRIESELAGAADPEQGEGSLSDFYPDLPEGLAYWEEMSIDIPYARHAATSPYPGVEYVYYDTEENKEVEEGFKRDAKPCYGVFELSLVDELTGRPKDRDIASETDETLNIYEDARLKRGNKLTFGHYIVVDVPRPDDEVDEEEPPEKPPGEEDEPE